jgi:2-methylcitrate dehydratase PrpD
VSDELIDFIRELEWSDVPPLVQRRAGFLLADHAAVAVAGRAAPASRIVADHASQAHSGDEAAALLDGRRLGVLGAAWSNGVLANALDMDDGHRITKGHPGAIVIPAALATAQLADAPLECFLSAVVVGYEVAIRAGMALHARDAAYHASGAWGAIGAAAAAASLLELPPDAVRHAIGLAEYHAPIAPIMRSVAQPAMTKDACGHGAWLGVSSTLLARHGFTAFTPELFDDHVGALEGKWRLPEVYVKEHPCCRWSQPAIRAALSVRNELAPTDRIERMKIRTFTAAGALSRRIPTTTEEAQYSLVWPVATAIVRGRFCVDDVLGPFGDATVAELARRTAVEIDPRMDAAFPERRLSAVEVELADGRTVASAPVQASGECDDPEWESLVAGKVARLLGAPRPGLAQHHRGGLRGLSADRLVGVLRGALQAPVGA